MEVGIVKINSSDLNDAKVCGDILRRIVSLTHLDLFRDLTAMIYFCIVSMLYIE